MKSTIVIIAGLDPTGGAGILADAEIVNRHGFRAAGVVTALTEQTTRGVSAANSVPGDVVFRQLRGIFADIPVAAIKIGMLGSEQTAVAVADALEMAELDGVPVVWDPVLRPSVGAVHLYQGSVETAVTRLRPLVTLVTPNALEAEFLSGAKFRGAEEAGRLASLGFAAVLLKGGHLEDNEAVDALVRAGEVISFRGPRVSDGESVHGTGCVLSTAITCGLARGLELSEAICEAKKLATELMASPQQPGKGAPSLV